MEELDRIRENALVERIVKHKPTVSSDYREGEAEILHVSEFKRVHGLIERDVSTHVWNHSAQIEKVVNSLHQLDNQQSAMQRTTIKFRGWNQTDEKAFIQREKYAMHAKIPNTRKST